MALIYIISIYIYIYIYIYEYIYMYIYIYIYMYPVRTLLVYFRNRHLKIYLDVSPLCPLLNTDHKFEKRYL